LPFSGHHRVVISTGPSLHDPKEQDVNSREDPSRTKKSACGKNPAIQKKTDKLLTHIAGTHPSRGWNLRQRIDRAFTDRQELEGTPYGLTHSKFVICLLALHVLSNEICLEIRIAFFQILSDGR
jgi:hypothetical protein